MNCRNLMMMASLVCLGGSFHAMADERAMSVRDRDLVGAAFELDVDQVKSLLKEGADPNARYGGDPSRFRDHWTTAYPMSSSRWTPLLAVANSPREPGPVKPILNTAEARAAAIKQRDAIDPQRIAERDERRMVITRLLIDAHANLNLDDGCGSTALDGALKAGYESVALLLIESGAKLDTKTGISAVNADAITPLHRATSHPLVMKAMLQRGAKVNVKSAIGYTPLHWAVQDGDVESVKLLLDAGADPDAEDDKGRSPAYWCQSTSLHHKQITELLAETKKNNYFK